MRTSMETADAGGVPTGTAPLVVPEGTRALRLWRGNDGQLWGQVGEQEARAVRVCRLFPWSHATEWISLRDAEDEELALVHRPADLDPESRSALEISLVEAGFVMQVESILAVDEEIEIRTFEVLTAQGKRSFQTERDAWPESLPDGGLLIRDVAGDLYAVPESARLDARSRKLMWVFVD